jgi:hypothetical protein
MRQASKDSEQGGGQQGPGSAEARNSMLDPFGGVHHLHANIVHENKVC